MAAESCNSETARYDHAVSGERQASLKMALIHVRRALFQHVGKYPHSSKIVARRHDFTSVLGVRRSFFRLVCTLVPCASRALHVELRSGILRWNEARL